jgi:hypothetical protein
MLEFYKKFAARKYCYFVTNSLGELDYIFPLILNIKKNLNQSTHKIFILNNKISEQFLHNKDLKSISRKLNTEVFAKSYKLVLSKNFKSNHLTEILFIIINFLNFLKYYYTSDIIFIENSGRSMGSKLLRLINIVKKKTIILIPHTSSKFTSQFKYKYKENQIVFRGRPYVVHEKKNIKSKKYINTGPPVFLNYPINNNWKVFIKENFKNENKKPYVCIYLNNFIDKKTYIFLLIVTIKSLIKANKNMEVLIKRHPRLYNFNEENIILNKIIKKFKNKINIKLSTTNTYILSFFSKINICLMSNAVFACQKMNRESVYFFFNSKEVRKRFLTYPIPIYFKSIKSFKSSKQMVTLIKKF